MKETTKKMKSKLDKFIRLGNLRIRASLIQSYYKPENTEAKVCITTVNAADHIASFDSEAECDLALAKVDKLLGVNN